MRVAVVNLTSGGLSGGYRKYLQIMLPLLREDPRVEALEVFAPEQVKQSFSLGNTGIVSWPSKDPWLGYPWLKSQLRRQAPDVVFIPTARWLDCGDTPTVIMVRNMEPLEVPFGDNPPLEKLKNVLRARTAKNACSRATRIIGVSQYVSDFIQNRWNMPPSKLGTVYHGIEEPSSADDLSMPATLPASEVDEFLFTAGSIRPARGLEDVIEALAILRDRGASLRLVVAGSVDPGMKPFKKRLNEHAARLGVADRILWAKYLSRTEMSWCFYHCRAFVTTSRAEACPNIALEAMAHGCHIVATTQPPMPEFFQGSALYYRPKDAMDLVEKIERVLSAPEGQKAGWRVAAQTRASDFQWTDTARKTVDELELAVSM